MKMNNNSVTTTATLLIAIVLTGTATAGVSVWAANLIGTSGPDTIVGTDEDDTIFGLEGDDDLSGKGGDDYIDGDGGNDKINDGLGSDIVRAGSGDDRIELEGVRLLFEEEEDGVDKAYGGEGEDDINVFVEVGFHFIFGEADDDTITTGASSGNTGRMYGGSGNDILRAGGDSNYDVWGGSGNDEIGGSSECSLDRVFGESGNDRIRGADEFTSGGSGNDVIQFTDCGGVAYGDGGNDELRGGDSSNFLELHGGSGDDILSATDGEDDLFGDDGDDTLTGGSNADSFSCGPGIDTITDFNAAEGDTKTADCENF
jgi:Ca2+-binding RTX toxin-like protein